MPRLKKSIFDLMKNAALIERPDPEQIALARQYAYSYFIQRQIPINIVNKTEGHFGNIDVNKLNDSLPGNNIIPDEICNSIINGKDVILDDKMVKEVEIGNNV
ncbi:MAG: hypothetical protein R2942_07145 [Ignavibacteria bacterium]